MPESAILETNWLLDLVLEQHAPSERLLVLAEAGSVELFLPSLSYTESIKAYEQRRSEWQRLISSMDDAVAQLGRSSESAPAAANIWRGAEALAAYGDRVETRLWHVLERVSRNVMSCELDTQALVLARDLRSLLNLSPADAAVLATVIGTSERCGAFISRDKRAFDAVDCRRYLRSRDIDLYSDPAHFLSAIGLA